MAEIIPALSRDVLSRMTAGERRFATRLKTLLEDDYTIWYDIPIGRQRRYPDFIVLHPSRGLLFIEVKDWKRSSIKKINQDSVQLITNNGLVNVANPFSQVRQYMLAGTNTLAKDPLLKQTSGKHKGKLAIPYGYGVVFTNISRKQIENAVPNEFRESLLPDHLSIYQDEMLENEDPEVFQQRLWQMFNSAFVGKLSLPQINRIRWHLFPEIRIDAPNQQNLFEERDPESAEEPVSNIIRIMDIQQEQLARGLGEGHRVIHGVAGSGKTLILGFRAQYLAEHISKPILVVCFNISLAAKLRSFIAKKGISEKIQVYHFHDWCGEQLRHYNVSVLDGEQAYWERQVASVIDAVDKSQIPRAQYGAVLIDEGHDFEADWLRLITQMIDPKTNSLLLLYDDAQSIYKKKTGLDFSLASVGIKASGRTSILRLNYRNSREILDFAYRFATDYFSKKNISEEWQLIKPEAAGCTGPTPSVHVLKGWQEEIIHTIQILKHWQDEGVPWGDIAIIYNTGYQGKSMQKALQLEHIPCLWMATKAYKQQYDPQENRITLLTLQSSKGLEFQRVLLVGVDKLQQDSEQQSKKLLYVGMTRAQQYLHISSAQDCELSRSLKALG